jgi:hypothetical protein
LRAIERHQPEAIPPAERIAVLAVAAAEHLGWSDEELGFLRIEAYFLIVNDALVDEQMAQETDWAVGAPLYLLAKKAGLLPGDSLDHFDSAIRSVSNSSGEVVPSSDHDQLLALCLLLGFDEKDFDSDMAHQLAGLNPGPRPHLLDAVNAVRPLIQPVHG